MMAEKWWLFAVAGVTATGLYLAEVSAAVNAACTIVVAVGAVAACWAGPRMRRAEPRAAWRLIGVATLLFLVGIVMRPFLPHLADAATLPGYLTFGGFMVLLLRSRRSLEKHTVLDGLIVTVAGGCASVLLLAVPTATLGGRPVAQSLLAAVYPLLDVLLVLVAVNLAFTARSWPPSLAMLLAGMVLMFAGDLGYAIIGIRGEQYASPLLDVPYLLAFTLLGTIALHPSVVQLGHADRAPVQAWSPARIALLVPALVTPFVLLVALRDPPWGVRLVIAACGVVIVLLLLLRAVTAVRTQAAAQQRAEHQARHDPLTGLPNRQMITEQVSGMLARLPRGEHRVWVYLLDLDGFKLVNDTWGHDTGDRLVAEIARRLRAAVPDDLPVATMGGDKFLFAYAGDRNGALRLADTARGCFTEDFCADGTSLPISASIGIAGSGPGDQAADALLRDADTAMHRAKDEGPGRVTVFDPAMHARVRDRIETELALRTALAEGQLTVAYQPIVDVGSGRPIGAEALVRWTHPERGAIPPGVFIPIAEDAGLIEGIGTFVRREAVRQLGEWRRDGVVGDDFYLSINVSPLQLAEPELPLIVSAELLTAGVPPACVALEVTESAMVETSSAAGRVLFELRELGFRILIDDFGTGFSALAYLRRFPATGLKIDRSFVAGLGAGAEDDEIVRAVVALAFALKLAVVAEGVETRQQRDVLAALGVVAAQGWLWGPAVPPAEFTEHWHHERLPG